MGCCGSSEEFQPITEEEKNERRIKAAQAAEIRSKNFAQGGGGEKLKKKAKKLEEAQAARGNDKENALQWRM